MRDQHLGPQAPAQPCQGQYGGDVRPAGNHFDVQPLAAQGLDAASLRGPLAPQHKHGL